MSGVRQSRRAAKYLIREYVNDAGSVVREYDYGDLNSFGAPIRGGSHDPIAYVYDADLHCPDCTPDDMRHEDATDSESNPVGVIAPWGEITRECDDCDGYRVEICGDCFGPLVEIDDAIRCTCDNESEAS